MPAPDYATEITALEKALATGELEIQSGGFGGDRVQYRSASEIMTALTYFRQQAAANASVGGNSSTMLAHFSRE